MIIWLSIFSIALTMAPIYTVIAMVAKWGFKKKVSWWHLTSPWIVVVFSSVMFLVSSAGQG